MGANVDALDGQGATALMWAAQAGDADMVKELLAVGADVAPVGPNGSALHFAMLNRGTPAAGKAIVRQLLDAGVDVNALDRFGRTALFDAVGSAELTKWLLDNAPDGREQVKAAVMKWLPVGLQSFGADRSKSNERYRYWGIKSRTNEEMRREYFAEVMPIIREKWGIDVPHRLEDWWNGKTAQAAGDGGYKYAGMSLKA